MPRRRLPSRLNPVEQCVRDAVILSGECATKEHCMQCTSASRSVLTALLWVVALVVTPILVDAQEATPGPAGAPLDVPLIDTSGAEVGTATFSEGARA